MIAASKLAVRRLAWVGDSYFSMAPYNSVDVVCCQRAVAHIRITGSRCLRVERLFLVSSILWLR